MSMNVEADARVRVFRSKKRSVRELFGTVEVATYRDAGHMWKEIPRWDLMVRIDGIGTRKLVQQTERTFAFSSRTMREQYPGLWRVEVVARSPLPTPPSEAA